MALYETREYTTRTYEWVLPSGCPASEFDKAWTAALATFRHVHGLAEDAVPDDGGWVQVHAVDDTVVLRFEERFEIQAAVDVQAAISEGRS